MSLQVAVYRRSIPSRRDWLATSEAASRNPLLARFLTEYLAPDRFYDWGDDPGFFCASETLGDPRLASWGVCRPDVRAGLKPGDVIAFFIFKPEYELVRGAPEARREASYYFIGCGTVDRLVRREQVWADASLAPYRSFFNVLARPDESGQLRNIEVFVPPHSDWRHRAETRMAIFDPTRSAFNLRTPHQVSRYEPTSGPPDVWNADPVSREIERLLFARSHRRLRTSATNHQHARYRAAEFGTETRIIRDALFEVAGLAK